MPNRHGNEEGNIPGQVTIARASHQERSRKTNPANAPSWSKPVKAPNPNRIITKETRYDHQASHDPVMKDLGGPGRSLTGDHAAPTHLSRNVRFSASNADDLSVALPGQSAKY